MTKPLNLEKSLSEQPRLSIVIVSWNCRLYLEECLASIFSAERPFPLEIIIVDNASSDETVAWLKSSFPGIKIVANPKNLGFPRSCNLGLKNARGEYFLLLNPDTKLQKDTLVKAVEFIEKNPDIGMLGVKIRRPDGSIQLHGGRAFPTLASLLFNSLGLDRAFPFLRLFSSPDMPWWDHENSQKVDMISGTFMLFRRAVYNKIMGLDETLPMFFEDMEYCWRVKKNGWEVFYLAETEILHYSGVSSSRASSFWITSLKYEANRLMLLAVERKIKARLYPLMVFILTPLRLFLFPLWLGALEIKKRKIYPAAYLTELAHSWLWALRTLINRKIDYSKFLNHQAKPDRQKAPKKIGQTK